MSIEQHSRARQVQLGRDILSCKKIYLDACFWILLRDTELGLRVGVPERKLLHFLRRGVRGGKLICPVSATVFIELMKQPFTAIRRQATAELIDELSLGVTAVDPKTLLQLEIHCFLLKARGDTAIYDMQELIWTKVAYVLGARYPVIPSLSPEDQLTIQSRFFDHLWDQSLFTIINIIGAANAPGDNFRHLSSETNVQNQQHRDELKSFEGTYDIELRGSIEFAGEIAADVIDVLASKDAGRSFKPTSEERSTAVKSCRNLLYFAAKKPQNRSALRSLHVGAAIHASMRWDKKRKFKPNDYYDFQHATIALAYCDAFFTEIPLHVLVTRPQVALERINNCEVISDIKVATDFVRKLVS